MNKKSYNQLYEMFIFTGLISMMLYLLITGRIGLYLHPKMVKYVVFALIMLIIIDIYWVWTYVKKTYRGRSFRYGTLLFLLPLIIAIINPSQISGTVLQNKTVNVGQQQRKRTEKVSEKDSEEKVIETMPEEVERVPEQEIIVEPEEELAIETVAEQEEEIIPDKKDDFCDLLIGMYTKPEQYIGKEVTLEGFVFKDDRYHEDTFVLGRLMMDCCAADSYITGVFVKYPDAPNLVADDWYNIKGVIEEDEVFNPFTEEFEMNMVLKPKELEGIEPYENPYIYP